MKLQKIICAVIASVVLLAIVIGMVSCSGEGNSHTQTESATGSSGETGGYTLPVSTDSGAVTLGIHQPATELLEKLGKPLSREESPSCAFEGNDVRYTYEHMVVETYFRSGTEYLYVLSLSDDTYATKEGIRIGSGADDVLTAYGEPTRSTDTAMIYASGRMYLQFLLRDATVVNIQYVGTTE